MRTKYEATIIADE